MTPKPHSTIDLDAEIASLQNDISRLKELLRQNQRLAALGMAAATIAHEINNLLTPVVGYARLALKEDDRDIMVKALETTLEQSEAVTAMTNRVLGMAVDAPPSFKKVSLREVIDDAVKLMGPDLRKDGVSLVSRVGDDLTVRADGRQLQQVFFNLLLNARDAIRGKSGRVTIKGSREGSKVLVAFSDNGDGVPEGALPHIFDPFFSTKAAPAESSARSGKTRNRPKSTGAPVATRKAGGTGLGLAICKDIIEEHGGAIDVTSAPGEGTTFTITLQSE